MSSFEAHTNLFCSRRVSIHVVFGVEKVFDFGVLNLETVFPKEERDLV